MFGCSGEGEMIWFNRADDDAEMELMKAGSPGFTADKSLGFAGKDSGSKPD